MAFPRTPVSIRQAGARRIVATQNHAVFYNRLQAYQRQLITPQGDRCAFIAVEPGVLEGCVRDWGRLPSGWGDFRFPFPDGPLDRADFVRERLLTAYLTADRCPDDLLVQETILLILGNTIGAAFAAAGLRDEADRPATAARHAELVERTKAILAVHFREPIGMTRLADSVNASPYHLARQFRTITGYSLHRYRSELRLRAATEQLARGREDLTELAVELGFASHSHFGDVFRRAYGVSPSLYRRRARHAGPVELRWLPRLVGPTAPRTAPSAEAVA